LAYNGINNKEVQDEVITRSHIHVDRVACPWLILWFVDNEAEFLFVPANQVKKLPPETGAIPFDAPDCRAGTP